jgi:hypothetical protein
MHFSRTSSEYHAMSTYRDVFQEDGRKECRLHKWEYLTVQLSSSHPIAPNAIPLSSMGLINGKEVIQNQPIHELGRD